MAFNKDEAGIPQAPRVEHEDALSFLQYFETMFIVDDSENMSRQWLDVSALMQAVAPTCLKYDENGIDIYFTNHRPLLYFPGMSVRKSGYNHIGKVHNDSGKRDNAQAIFQSVKPGGKCKLGARLDKILSWYTAQLKEDPQRPPLNIIIITAGISSDDYTAPIVKAAKELDAMQAPAHQLGLMLFQLGDNEEVRKAFEHADDDLWQQAKTRDIVDTVAWRGWPASFGADDMVKAVLGAVNKKMDGVKSELVGKPPPKHRETMN
ncbi:putative VWFA domain-containing protein [Seiridium unicorne]|uniref:VWFA domain-containing protein n=1 Tax=Seiridium unicorne TaxID=138068 RepID=A0ABR2URT9_9PEZI